MDIDSLGYVYACGIIKAVADFGNGTDLLYSSPLTVDWFTAKFNSTNSLCLWANRYSNFTDQDQGFVAIMDEAASQVVFAGQFTGLLRVGGAVGQLNAATGSSTNGVIIRVWA